MVAAVHERLGIATADMVEWTRTFVRHASPQTEKYEAEPQVQSLIGEKVLPVVQKLGLASRRDKMGNLIVELGPQNSDRSRCA